MHTISETGHTKDILAAIAGMEATFRDMDKMNRNKGISTDDLKNNHARLDTVSTI
jgi:endoglucanase